MNNVGTYTEQCWYHRPLKPLPPLVCSPPKNKYKNKIKVLTKKRGGDEGFEPISNDKNPYPTVGF